MSTTPATDDRPPLSRDPRVAWGLLLTALPLGGWLLWEIQRTIGLNAPRFWELLRTDRVFDLAMLDFFLTAAWALLVLIERPGPKRWGFWLALIVFCAIPSVGIALFLLLDRPVTVRPGSTA